MWSLLKDDSKDSDCRWRSGVFNFNFEQIFYNALEFLLLNCI